MADTFAEQLVIKAHSSSDTVKKAFILAGGGIAMALLIKLCTVSFFALLPAAVLGVWVYHLLTGLNVEYEYTITNGTLDIDKIIAQRKRVSMISADVRNFTAFGSYEEADESSNTTILAIGGEEKLYYAEFKSESYGEVRLVFSPNEKILNCIKPYLSGNVKR